MKVEGNDPNLTHCKWSTTEAAMYRIGLMKYSMQIMAIKGSGRIDRYIGVIKV